MAIRKWRLEEAIEVSKEGRSLSLIERFYAVEAGI